LANGRERDDLIRVQIETASAVTRAGLDALLAEQPEIEVVASGANVILAEEASGAGAAAPVVVLTDETPVRDALRAGARAVLPRDATPGQIIAAIYAAAAGLVAVPAAESACITPQVRVEEIAEPLTPREMDVLEMLGEGLSNKLIAYRLSISEHTAKFHVNSILAKLNAATRTEAATRGIRLGLIKI
jgi:DNA-binding NarL/FixJ family response regulator